MPQLHLYLPEKDAERVRQRARAAGVAVSKYLAALVLRQLEEGWPEGFFDDVVGGWQGEPLERPPAGSFEPRERL